MINEELSAAEPPRRVATAREYLMCPPEHFAVTYAINPWMQPDTPADAAVAMRQWARLRQIHLDLGHDVRTIERFYHLDTAMCVLDSDTVMYYPAAFDDAGRAALAEHFAELIEAKDEDAEVLGLNAVSDGRHVVLPAQAQGLAAQLAARGFEPVPVDMSELLKAGGGPKCCALELR